MQLLEQIRDAGIVGCGGAGFPTHAKLNCTVEYLIINAAECEPLLRTDRWLMVHKSREIIDAANRMTELVQASQAYIALKETYREEAAALEDAIEDTGSRVKLFKLRNFYPAGDEQVMVCDVTGRTVPPAGIPLDVGAVVSNLATTYQIYLASQDMPFTHKYLTVTGEVASPAIVHAPLGTSFAECIAAAGGPKTAAYHVLSGGPMMGKLYSREDASQQAVTKTTSGIIVVPDGAALVKKRSIPLEHSLRRARTCCIQCSYCTQMCPRYLTGHPLEPHKIMRKLAYAPDADALLGDKDVQQAMICSECGLCETYACPMGLQPRQVNIYLKAKLRGSGFKYQKPDGPFEALEARDYRRAPSKRMAMRLEVDPYYDYRIDRLEEAAPSSVRILLRQHIGAAGAPVVKTGDHVTTGQLIAAVPGQALGANIHASIDGTVTQVTDDAIVLSR